MNGNDELLRKNKGIGPTSRVYLDFLAVAALVFAIIAIAVLPRTWRTTDASLERVAQATAEAGIWVLPNMVFYDYIRRVNGDEYYSLGVKGGVKTYQRGGAKLYH